MALLKTTNVFSKESGWDESCIWTILLLSFGLVPHIFRNRIVVAGNTFFSQMTLKPADEQ